MTRGGADNSKSFDLSVFWQEDRPLDTPGKKLFFLDIFCLSFKFALFQPRRRPCVSVPRIRARHICSSNRSYSRACFRGSFSRPLLGSGKIPHCPTPMQEGKHVPRKSS